MEHKKWAGYRFILVGNLYVYVKENGGEPGQTAGQLRLITMVTNMILCEEAGEGTGE